MEEIRTFKDERGWFGHKTPTCIQYCDQSTIVCGYLYYWRGKGYQSIVFFVKVMDSLVVSIGSNVTTLTLDDVENSNK